MAKEENLEPVSVLQKQGLKGAAFLVEVYVDKDGKQGIIIKTPNGLPVRFLENPQEVSEFLIEVIDEITSKDER